MAGKGALIVERAVRERLKANRAEAKVKEEQRSATSYAVNEHSTHYTQVRRGRLLGRMASGARW
jgi:hypothetical protein